MVAIQGSIEAPVSLPVKPEELNRNLVERFFNKIKQCCRIKLAANYLAPAWSIRLWLHVHA
jgi:hypothetical protein